MNRWIGVAATVFMLGFSPLVAEEMAASESNSGLSVEIKIGTSLENREVVGEAETFPADTAQLVGWTRVTGATEPTQITHAWKFNDKEVGTVPLKITSSPFRTNSRKTVMGAGTYSLDVLDADGKLIASKKVQVQ